MVESSGLLSRTRELSLAEVQILHPPFLPAEARRATAGFLCKHTILVCI